MGSAAVPALTTLLHDPQQHVRWEAAKALTEIADPSSAERLVAALGDEDTDVRWVVGEALVALGQEAIAPLLRCLTRSDLTGGVYRGAHHVLRHLVKRGVGSPSLEAVIQSLDQLEPEVAVPPAAAKALQEIGG
jgi:HEAT repeat protein